MGFGVTLPVQWSVILGVWMGWCSVLIVVTSQSACYIKHQVCGKDQGHTK